MRSLRTAAAAVPLCFFLVLLAESLRGGHFSARQSALVFEPRSGECVLPEKVLQALEIIRETGIVSYRVSPGFKQDVLRRQRMVEAAWLDARPDPDSRYLLLEKSEARTGPDQRAAAPTIMEKKDVALVLDD